MMLRSLPYRALMAATLAIAVMPLHGQSTNNQGNDSSQQANLPYPGKVVEQIVARVDDQVIDTSDYQRAEQDLEQQARQQNWSQAELDQQKKNLLRNLIDNQLLLAKGKQLGISGEDELIHRLDQIRKQNHLDSMQGLQQAVEAQGLSWEDFRQQIRQNIIREDVIRQEVAPTIRISPQDVQQYYNDHQSDFKHPEEVRLSEILIPTPNPDDAAQVAQAQQKADSVESKLKSGVAFANLAKVDSNGPTAAQGGDLGEFQKGQLAPELEQATFSLKAGQYTRPIRTKQGWIILQVTKHQDAGVAPLNQVEVQVENEIGYNKMQPALRAYLEKLRNQSYIDIRPGYHDSGATPNEMKPIYSAYLPPSGKLKKKHETRVRYDAYHRGRHYRHRKTETAGNQQPEQKETKHSHRRRHHAETAEESKPGKKEKIRYGQAPRENLPPVLGQPEEQSAQTANGEEVNAQPGQETGSSKGPKGRFGSKANATRLKKKKVDDHHPAAVVGKAAEATQQEQESSLGLEGNTDKKKKKAHPMRKGPKRRYSKVQLKQEEQKKQEEQQNQQPSAANSSSTNSSTQPQR